MMPNANTFQMKVDLSLKPFLRGILRILIILLDLKKKMNALG